MSSIVSKGFEVNAGIHVQTACARCDFPRYIVCIFEAVEFSEAVDPMTHAWQSCLVADRCDLRTVELCCSVAINPQLSLEQRFDRQARAIRARLFQNRLLGLLFGKHRVRFRAQLLARRWTTDAQTRMRQHNISRARH